jgi:hypothetical protein
MLEGMLGELFNLVNQLTQVLSDLSLNLNLSL